MQAALDHAGGREMTAVARAPGWMVWALGVTQIIGYGTLYYSFGTLAPRMAQTFGWPEASIFAAMSAALLLGGLVAPLAGSLADRFGAGAVMSAGSVAAALALAVCALAPDAPVLAAALLASEVAASFVLYPVAFSALVQAGGAAARRQITHLTLIAGFASTLFWPLTSALEAELGWRGTYLVFVAMNLFACVPLHLAMAGHARRRAGVGAPAMPPVSGIVRAEAARPLFGLMLSAFALQGMLASAVLMNMVPMLSALGIGQAGLVVAALFGPAQVMSRMINMGWGGGLSQPRLAVIAASLMPVGALVLVLTAPSPIGAALFAVCFGLGSGLSSIVGGTLPLVLFGSGGYGRRAGLVNAGRQIAASIAPFLFVLTASAAGTPLALLAMSGLGAAAVVAFATITWWTERPGASS